MCHAGFWWWGFTARAHLYFGLLIAVLLGDKSGSGSLRSFSVLNTPSKHFFPIVLAPDVKTFYAQVSPTLFVRDADYLTWLNRNAPWLLAGRPDPAGTRTYWGDSLFLKMGDQSSTPMAVLKLLQPSFQTCAAVAGKTGNYTMAQLLIRNNFDVKSTSSYTAGSFYVGGLDPVAGRMVSNPPPAAAKGKAFAVASEPGYRLLIASNP